jgi:hypothetical protein
LRQNGFPYIGSQWSNNSSNIYIIGSNIGIGVSNPASALVVAGDVEFRSNIALANQQFVFRGLKVLKNSNMGASTTNVTSAVTSIPGYSYASSNHTYSNTSTNYFSIVAGTTETARFTGNNRLGLGIAIPAYPLDVSGDINFSGILRQGGVPYIGSQWSNNSTNVFLLGSNVGIGTTTPSSILHLASNAATNVIITLCNTTTGANPAYIGLSNSGQLVLATVSNHAIALLTSNVERMRITSNGFVGIGTTAPSSILHLASNAAANVLVTFCNTATGANPATFGLNSTGDVLLTATSNNNLVFGTSNVERMRITSNGNVGIGATNPQYLLHVHNASVFVGDVASTGTVTSGTPSAGRIVLDNTFNNVAGAGTRANKLVLFNNTTLANAEVGLGVETGASTYHSTLAHRFYVAANGYGTSMAEVSGYGLTCRSNIFLNTYPNVNNGIFFRSGFTTPGDYNCCITIFDHGVVGTVPDGISVNGYGGVSICTGANTRQERLRVTGTGYVGIGTTNPVHTFQVNPNSLGVTSAAVQFNSLGTGADSTNWIAASIGGNGTSSAPRVVIGAVAGGATVGAHASSLGAWADLYLNGDANMGTTGKKGVVIKGNSGGGTEGYVGIGLVSPTFQLQLSVDSAAKPTSTTWTVSSDARLKNNIVEADIDRCVEIVRTLPLKRYTWKDEVFTSEQTNDRSKLGWIAQDVETVLPKAVEKHDMLGYEDCRTLNADQIYAVMYGALQKAFLLIDELRTEVDILKATPS